MGQQPGLRLLEEAAIHKASCPRAEAEAPGRRQPLPAGIPPNDPGGQAFDHPRPIRAHTGMRLPTSHQPQPALGELTSCVTHSLRICCNQGGSGAEGGALVANRRPQEAAWTMLFLLLSYWLAVASVVCKLVEHPPTQALGYPGGLTRGWGGGGIPQRPASASVGPQRCFLVVQEPGPSVASSSFRKPNCSFIF